jgi:ASC-1-like (ASCH) protein
MESSVTVCCNLKPIYFGYVKTGEKSIEIRVKRDKWATVRRGTILGITNEATGETIMKRVVAVREYRSFGQALVEEGLHRTLPGLCLPARTIESGKAMYEAVVKFNEGDVVIAIELS